MVGYALKFGELGKVIKNGKLIYERITKNALKDADLSNVILNLNHDDTLKLASTFENTLKLTVDNVGLKVEAFLDVKDAFAMKVYKMVKRGLINQMSFRAEFLERKQVLEDDVPVFLVEKLGRFEDVSIVDIPAYKTAEIEARSQKGQESMEEKTKDLQEDIKKDEEKEETSKETEEVVTNVDKEIEKKAAEAAKENGTTSEEEVKRIVSETIKALQAEYAEKDKENNEDTKEEPTKKDEKNEMLERGVKTIMDVNTIKNTNVDVRSTDEYKAVWAESIRTGKMDKAAAFLEERGIKTNGSNGEKNLVPTELQDFIETELREGGRVASLCKIVSIHGLYSIPVEKSATDAAIHVEGSGAPTEETITFGQVLIDADYIKKWISVTDKMLAMTNIDLANYLIDELKNKILEFLDELVINGTGAVKGVLQNSDEMFVKKLTLTPQELATSGLKAQAHIKANGTPTVVMNRSFFFNHVASLTDTQGRPLFVETIVNDRVVYMFNGMPVVLSNSKSLADTLEDDKEAMIIGTWKEAMLLNMPEGNNVIVKIDENTGAKENIVYFIGKILVGGNITKLHSFATVKFAKGE